MTDQELAALKDVLKTHRSIGPLTVAALIERLEAAERVIQTVVSPDDGLTESGDTNKALDAWRKAAGK